MLRISCCSDASGAARTGALLLQSHKLYVICATCGVGVHVDGDKSQCETLQGVSTLAERHCDGHEDADVSIATAFVLGACRS